VVGTNSSNLRSSDRTAVAALFALGPVFAAWANDDYGGSSENDRGNSVSENGSSKSRGSDSIFDDDAVEVNFPCSSVHRW
jgi:hypothetical protein